MNPGARLTATLLSLFSVVFLAGLTTASTGGPWIGVYTQTIDKDLMEAFDLDRTDGILIVDVMHDSPADKAGLKRKDIVIAFDGEKVDGTEPLADFVARTKPGDKVELVLVRSGEEKKIFVEIGSREASPESSWDSSPRDRTMPRLPRGLTAWDDDRPGSYIGVGIQPLTDQLGQYFGVRDGAGILVTEVTKDSPAQRAGIKAGDVIVTADDKKIASTDELQVLISGKKKGDTVSLGLIRREQKQTVVVEVDQDNTGTRGSFMPNLQLPQLPSTPRYRLYGGEKSYTHDDIQELRDEISELRRELKDLKDRLK
jgi:S1-C subfamily serine protease